MYAILYSEKSITLKLKLSYWYLFLYTLFTFNYNNLELKYFINLLSKCIWLSDEKIYECKIWHCTCFCPFIPLSKWANNWEFSIPSANLYFYQQIRKSSILGLHQIFIFSLFWFKLCVLKIKDQIENFITFFNKNIQWNFETF